MTLAKGYSRYGADMGRRSQKPPADFAGQFKALEMHLDEGGYDSGGAYWGSATSRLGKTAQIWRFTCETEDENLEHYVRLTDFGAAGRYIAREFPRATVVKEIGSDRLDEFVLQYERTALWASTGDDEEPLDSADVEVSDEARAAFRKDCEAFLQEADAIAPDESDSDLAHDFWLTRNRHGAGFWDGDYPKAIGDKLTELAQKFGEVDLYVGDDGKVYQS